MSTTKPQPPKHGQIKLGAGMKIEHAKKHLAMMTEGAAEVRDYGGHDVTGQASQGAMSQGGASGADYATSSVDSDDSGGPAGY